MPRPVKTLAVSDAQRGELRAIVNSPTSTFRQNRRAWVILNRANGLSQEQTAGETGLSRQAVNRWESRFIKAGLAGLEEGRRSGRKPTIDSEIRKKILSRATQP